MALDALVLVRHQVREAERRAVLAQKGKRLDRSAHRQRRDLAGLVPDVRQREPIVLELDQDARLDEVPVRRGGPEIFGVREGLRHDGPDGESEDPVGRVRRLRALGQPDGPRLQQVVREQRRDEIVGDGATDGHDGAALAGRDDAERVEGVRQHLGGVQIDDAVRWDARRRASGATGRTAARAGHPARPRVARAPGGGWGRGCVVLAASSDRGREQGATEGEGGCEPPGSPPRRGGHPRRMGHFAGSVTGVSAGRSQVCGARSNDFFGPKSG